MINVDHLQNLYRNGDTSYADEYMIDNFGQVPLMFLYEKNPSKPGLFTGNLAYDLNEDFCNLFKDYAKSVYGRGLRKCKSNQFTLELCNNNKAYLLYGEHCFGKFPYNNPVLGENKSSPIYQLPKPLYPLLGAKTKINSLIMSGLSLHGILLDKDEHNLECSTIHYYMFEDHLQGVLDYIKSPEQSFRSYQSDLDRNQRIVEARSNPGQRPKLRVNEDRNNITPDERPAPIRIFIRSKDDGRG